MHLFPTDTITVYRLEDANNQESYGATPVYQNVDCQILPASDEIIAIYGGGMIFSSI